MGLFDRRSELQRSYDAIASEYVAQEGGELALKPADCKLLDRFAEALSDSGPCVDLGCGPGHITRYLHEHGVDISGIDISAKMIKQAKKRNPGIRFKRGDMRELDVEDNHYAAVVSRDSIIHTPAEDLVPLLLEYHRVLEPGGALLLAFSIGQGSEHLDEWWGQSVDLDIHYFRTLDVIMYLQRAGFEQVSTYTRDPYPDIESAHGRAYIVAEALPGIPPARQSARLIP